MGKMPRDTVHARNRPGSPRLGILVRARFAGFVGGFMAVMLLSLGRAAALAQEDVIHRRNGIVDRGKIISQDATGVRLLRSDSRKEMLIPADQIERIEVKLTAEQQDGERLFEQQDYAAAATKLEAALAIETRPFLRNRIAAQMVACHVAKGEMVAAIDAFFTVSQYTGGQLPWSAVPVWWLPEPPPSAVLSRASGMLRSSSALEQVIGASLLFGTSESEAAREVLARLTTYRDERVGQLARTQLWRWDAATATAADVASWQRQAAKLPADLRAGPYFAIGLALRRAKAHDDAALAFLWPALVFKSDPKLARRASLYAAEALEQAAQTSDARQIYEEIVSKYAASPEAATARTRIAAMRK